MRNKTKQVFILSLVIAVLTVGGLAFFYSKISAEGKLLEEQIAILSDNNNKQSTSVRIKRLIEETVDERNKLTSSFFKDEGDSITFLSDIEKLAADARIDLKTDALDKIVDPKTSEEYIKVIFSYLGTKDQVYTFSELLENIPYHSSVDSLTLRQLPGGNWEGKTTLLITINPS